MKYEIEIDDSLVPEGKVPVSLSRDRTSMLELKFKKAPKLPDFVPEGWYLSINRYGVAKMHEEKPYLENGLWRCRGARWNVTSRLVGVDLPQGPRCFQQKGRE